MAKVGERAPELALQDGNGNTVRIGNYLGQKVVVYFYPKDMTPGCTTEACDFRDLQDKFKKAGVTILGVSPDPVERHQTFTAKYDLNFPLLADVAHEAAEAYGVWKEKSFMGRKYMGIERTTVLVNERGRVEHVWRKVSVPGHAKDVLTVAKGGKPMSKDAIAKAAAVAKKTAAKKKAAKAAAAAKKKAAKAKAAEKATAKKKKTAAKKKKAAAKKKKTAAKKKKTAAKKKKTAKKKTAAKKKKTAKKKTAAKKKKTAAKKKKTAAKKKKTAKKKAKRRR